LAEEGRGGRRKVNELLKKEPMVEKGRTSHPPPWMAGKERGKSSICSGEGGKETCSCKIKKRLT